MKDIETIECIEFVIEEYFNAPIKDGALKGEMNPSLAIEKMVEIAQVLKEARK